MNAGITNSIGDYLVQMGGIAVERVRLKPAPGAASIEDLLRENALGKPRCELVDNTLVEKAMGYEASIVAGAILEILRRFIVSRKLGLVSGPDGLFKLLASSVRGPDVAFVSRERLPDGRIPTDAYPAIAPDLAVEVLSPGNTRGEMARKRIEYFHSGVKLVWIVDCEDRSVAAYTSPSSFVLLNEADTITADEVLPGFSNPVTEFFADLDLGVE